MRRHKETDRISYYELIEGLSEEEKKIISKYLDFNTATAEELISMIKKLQENEQKEICLIFTKKVRHYKRKRFINIIRLALLYVKYIIFGIIIGLILFILSRYKIR